MPRKPKRTPQLFVLAGPNGAGKSTVAPFLLRDEYRITDFVNADVIARGLSGFSPESAAIEAGRIMLERLHALGDSGESFAFETTLASRSLAPWIAKLRESGYFFRLNYVWVPSAETSVARVAHRVRLGGHNVPESDIRRRFKRSICNFFELYQPIADEWIVWDNSELGRPRRICYGDAVTRMCVLNDKIWATIVAEQSDETR